MKWFGKKDRVVDLSERMKRQQEKVEAMKEEIKEAHTTPVKTGKENPSVNVLKFLGSMASSMPKGSVGKSEERNDDENEQEEYIEVSGGLDEKRRKLAKRLSDMTTSLENLSNKIYKIEQRLDLIERKLNLGHH